MPELSVSVEQKLPPEVELELQQLREHAAAMHAAFARVQALIAAGWIQGAPGEAPIETLLREITLLRAERTPPPVQPSVPDAVIMAFGIMNDKLRLSLKATDRTIQQTRFEAFQVGVETLFPLLISHGRIEGCHLIQNLLDRDIAETQAVLNTITNGHAQKSEALVKNVERLQADLGGFRAMSSIIGQLISGGLTPEQAIQRADAERAQRLAAVVPQGATIN